jgi:hypothetical protein
MQPSERLQLKIVAIIEPLLCTSCRFAGNATVEMSDGTRRCMFHCKRRDCDNWRTREDQERPIDIIEMP